MRPGADGGRAGGPGDGPTSAVSAFSDRQLRETKDAVVSAASAIERADDERPEQVADGDVSDAEIEHVDGGVVHRVGGPECDQVVAHHLAGPHPVGIGSGCEGGDDVALRDYAAWTP